MPVSAPVPRRMARSMVSLGMLPALASRMALRKRALASGSPPPERAATVISLMNLVKSLPRLASVAPFLCLIECHFECPDIEKILQNLLVEFDRRIYHRTLECCDLSQLFQRRKSGN